MPRTPTIKYPEILSYIGEVGKISFKPNKQMDKLWRDSPFLARWVSPTLTETNYVNGARKTESIEVHAMTIGGQLVAIGILEVHSLSDEEDTRLSQRYWTNWMDSPDAPVLIPLNEDRILSIDVGEDYREGRGWMPTLSCRVWMPQIATELPPVPEVL